MASLQGRGGKPEFPVGNTDQGLESALSFKTAESSSGEEADVEDESNSKTSKGGKTDASPSLFQKLKEKVSKTEENVREEAARKDKNSNLRTKPPAESGLGDELGTGYEEDSEKGGLSSEESADMSGKRGFPPQSENLFKPVSAKDDSELSLEELRANRSSQPVSDVQAPGLLGRVYEEVEAVADQVLESFSAKKKEGPVDEKGGV